MGKGMLLLCLGRGCIGIVLTSDHKASFSLRIITLDDYTLGIVLTPSFPPHPSHTGLLDNGDPH